MKYVILIVLLLIITACQSPAKIPPAPKVVEVKILYPVPCVESMPNKPFVHDDLDLLALNDYDFVQAIHKDRLILDEYARKQDILLKSCLIQK
jgi:hypothetical protein